MDSSPEFDLGILPYDTSIEYQEYTGSVNLIESNEKGL
jgi:hypothetical protein